MKPIIVKNEKLLDRLSIVINIGAITLYPFIIHRGQLDENEYILNHEKIHLKQQAELLLIGFYALYVMWWAWGRLKGLNGAEAYMAIPFEREAYDNDVNLEYLKSRKRFSWINYIRKT